VAAFKIATWNVNSLRVRLPYLLSWLAAEQPDVLALQETKLTNEDFPVAAIHEAGYTSIFSGQKTYNGVAMLIKQKTHQDIITDLPQLNDPQRRVLGALIEDIFVLNLYVPNGQSVGSEKYQYKLTWLKHLDNYLQTELKKYPRMLILGDFNIAPEEIDVHDPAQWQDQVLFSLVERQAFRDLLKIGFQDCFRKLHPTQQQYSWWDYRLNAFKRNMGLRIDHILASDALAEHCTICHIDKTLRAGERPSDHVPVIAEFK